MNNKMELSKGLDKEDIFQICLGIHEKGACASSHSRINTSTGFRIFGKT